MLSFQTNMIVKEKRKGPVKCGTRNYDAFRVEVADLEMYALFKKSSEVKEGDCITCDATLAPLLLEECAETVALRIREFEVVPQEDYVPMEVLNVKVNGKMYKPLNSEVRLIKKGDNQIEFLTSTLSVKNVDDSFFRLLMVSFGEQAKVMGETEGGSFLNLRAELHKQKREDNFELHVIDFDIAHKRTDVDKKEDV